MLSMQAVEKAGGRTGGGEKGGVPERGAYRAQPRWQPIRFCPAESRVPLSQSLGIRESAHLPIIRENLHASGRVIVRDQPVQQSAAFVRL